MHAANIDCKASLCDLKSDEFEMHGVAEVRADIRGGFNDTSKLCVRNYKQEMQKYYAEKR